jgi:adenylate cyclase
LEGSDPLASELQAKRARGLRTALILAVLVVVLRYLDWTSHLFVFSLPENFAYDTVFDYRAPRPPTDLAIVAIDDPTLQALGQFPFPRDVYARLLDKLAGAKVVAFDVLFVEPDRVNPQGDALFAAAIKKQGRVVLGAYKQERAKVTGPARVSMANYPLPAGGPGPLQPIQPLNFAGPVALLGQAAAGIGYVDIEPDRDGVYRRVDPLRVGYDGKVYPHLAVEIARLATGGQPADLGTGLPQGALALPGAAPAPLSAEGATLINYCGPPGTVPTYSFIDVLQGKHTAELQDKIVLVGATAAGLYDMRPAPYRSYGRKFFGVETNANIVNTLLHGPALRDDGRSFAWLGLALLLGVSAGVLVWSGGETVGPLLGFLVLVAVALPSFFVAFFAWGRVVPYGALMLAVLLPVAVGAWERMGAERRLIKNRFGVYVSPEVLEELTRDPELARRGQRRPVTLLFADVRGSTTLSEALPPETWLAQLNEYLSAMSDAIFAYDGYLDKFMGDGIMAVWDAFGTQPNHAELAVAAARRMLELLAALNRHWETAEDRTPFRIGIGLHSGEAVVGNVGSQTRTQYTVIGDVVNTASRIEGMTKEYQVELLLSDATAALLPERDKLREIGEVQVRGRAGTVKLYTIENHGGGAG